MDWVLQLFKCYVGKTAQVSHDKYSYKIVLFTFLLTNIGISKAVLGKLLIAECFLRASPSA